MPVVLLFEAPFARGDDVGRRLAHDLGYQFVPAGEIFATAERLYRFPAARLERAVAGGPSVFNAFTHEHERAIAYLKGAMASLIERDGWVTCSPATLLVPSAINTALRVCLVGTTAHRATIAAAQQGLTPSRAERLVAREDARQAAWVRHIADAGPWDPSLYDVVLPTHAGSTDDAAAQIRTHVHNPALQPTDRTPATIADFRLAAAVTIALAEQGHDVDVSCENGYATIVLNRFTVRVERLEDEVKRLARAIDGIRDVTTRVGPRFRPPSRDVQLDADTPAKILLVDDEQEYVQTLSERLLARNVGTAVALSGEEALEIIESDEPEVVVLDLQMPGIDGIEVLRRVKKGHPDTQVIILTGHGSDRERKVAEELGAFAYLNKPVDISVLSRTMKEAYRIIRQRRPGGTESA